MPDRTLNEVWREIFGDLIPAHRQEPTTMKTPYELDATDRGYIEQLTRWRVQEIDGIEPVDGFHRIELEQERAHLMMLRLAFDLRNDAASMAKNPKKPERNRPKNAAPTGG